VLDTSDATALLGLSPRSRQHALMALAPLSKYRGRYDKFQQIRQRYSLIWSNGNNSLQAMQRFFDPGLSLGVMLNKIKEMIRVLPAHRAAAVRHACLTGLRPAEAVESVRLLLASGIPDGNYYNPERQAL
jgi:hypothetical protein